MSIKAIQQKFESTGLKGWLYCCLLIIACSILFSGCTAIKVNRKVLIPKKVKKVKLRQVPKLEVPDFAPVTEDLSPLKTRIVNISARSTPLRDVLHVIAEASALNLVMERGVDPDIPMTLILKNISVEDALATIFAAVDYFYTVKNNMLIIKAVDTKIFEIGHPAITQTYSVDVGGDILSGAAYAAGGSGGIRGSIAQSIKGDTTAFDFWTTMEKSITSIVKNQASTDKGVRESVIINRMTGTIFVTAAKRNLERVEQFINTVKKVISRQVMVEARIIEVQLSESMQFGIDWSLIADLGSSQITFGQDFSSALNSTLPAFSINVAGGDFTSVLKALQQQGEVRTLSNPKINIMNGQTSLLSVGRSETFISKVETTTTSGPSPVTTFSITTGNVLSGIVLGIVPFINEQGEISMTITPIISNLVKFETVSIGTGGTETEISLPTIDLRELSTTVKVRDGQMVIIGGLISKTETLDENQVPWLSDIPLIGGLFKSKDKSTEKSELVVLLLPKIVS